jgi:hypothetical protein
MEEQEIRCSGYNGVIMEIGDISEIIPDGYCYVEIYSKFPSVFDSGDGYYHPMICQLFYNKIAYDRFDNNEKNKITLKDFNMITYYEGYSDIKDIRYNMEKYLIYHKLDYKYIMDIKKITLYAII